MAAKYQSLTEIPGVALGKVNYGHIALAYRRQRLHAHPRTAKTKKKSEIWMSSAKWFRQKGTGRARQGPRSNPHLRGGGVVFGPIPGQRTLRLNRKVRRNALLSALQHHLNNQSVKLLVGEEFEGFVKTKDAYSALLDSGFSGRGLVIVPQDALVWRALRNIAGITALPPDRLNVGDLVDAHFVIFTERALAEAQRHLTGEEPGGLAFAGDPELESPAEEITAGADEPAEGGGDGG